MDLTQQELQLMAEAINSHLGGVEKAQIGLGLWAKLEAAAMALKEEGDGVQP